MGQIGREGALRTGLDENENLLREFVGSRTGTKCAPPCAPIVSEHGGSASGDAKPFIPRSIPSLSAFHSVPSAFLIPTRHEMREEERNKICMG